METLVFAIFGIGSFVAVVFVFGAVSEKLKERTGKDVGDWFETLVAISFAIVIGRGGLYLVQWGMSVDGIALVIIGIIIMCVAGVAIWGAFFDSGDSGYDPMSGKRALQ